MTGRVVEVRATVNLPGLSVGSLALVDPERPYIKTCLDSGMIVPTGRTAPAVAPIPARGAVRPAPAAAEKKSEPTSAAKKKRKKKAPSTTDAPRDAQPS